MNKRLIVLLSSFLLFTACKSSHQLLKAPCVYDARSGCGPVIPLHQTIDQLAVSRS